jgi:hypothetical protein
MEQGRIVSSPDGDRWLVKRRWSNRPLPDVRRRWGKKNRDRAASAGLETAFWGLDSSIVATVVAAVVVALAVFVFLPLIGIAFELILLFLLISSGILGRVFLRRPWIVEATNLDHPERSTTFRVKGWRRSGQAIEELARTIPATGLPAKLSARG